ncbi:hypothetical protein GCM10027262_74770 [Nocardia tengchongensis]
MVRARGRARTRCCPTVFRDETTIGDLTIRDSRLTIQIQPTPRTLSLTSGPMITLDTPDGPKTSPPPRHWGCSHVETAHSPTVPNPQRPTPYRRRR